MQSKDTIEKDKKEYVQMALDHLWMHARSWEDMTKPDGIKIITEADGTRLWERTHGSDSIGEGANSVVQTADGGFVIAGERAVPLPIPGNTYLLRVDEQGNDLWSRTFESHDNIWSSASSVLQNPDGGFIVAGKVGSFPPDEMDRGIFLMKIDSEGNYDPLR